MMRVTPFTYNSKPTNTHIAGCEWDHNYSTNNTTISHSKNYNTLLFLQHATGFCKEQWDELVNVLHSNCGVNCPIVATDARNHGDSQHGFSSVPWKDMIADQLYYLNEVLPPPSQQSRKVIGIGHSMGGTTLVLTEQAKPHTYACLILIEPITPPPPYRREQDHPLALATYKRKDTFTSKESIFQNYSKYPFSAFTKHSLRAYIDGAFKEVEEDGKKVWKLKCTPSEESEFYREGSAHGAYENLGKLDIPVLIIAGENSTIPTAMYDNVVERIGNNAKLVVIKGSSHFVVMEKPHELAEVIIKFIRDCGLLHNSKL